MGEQVASFTKFTDIGNKNNFQFFPDVNYKFFQNKDGRYSWRPLQIINPAIYAYLVKELTKEHNWELIVERFKEFEEDDHIRCYSLPIVNHSLQTVTSETVLDWWDSIEQQSIKLSMDYNYLMITDISDCYSSIYTHSITWAMCGIEIAKKITQQPRHTDEEKEVFKNSFSKTERGLYKLGDDIDKIIRSMSYQQTNGIPQGSVLMDFIAELVLGYADLELSKKLSTMKDLSYKILRYRDDYRIFGNTQEDVIKIAKILTEELSKLNFRLNTQKTLITQDLICDAIKQDKIYYITRDYKRLEEPHSVYTLQKHLLRINLLSKKHPNSGSLRKAMDKFFKRICEWKELDLFKEADTAEVLISIATNIAFNNPKIYKEYVAIIGKILSYETDDNKKQEIIQKILNKFHQLPNVGYLEIWLQRLTIKNNRSENYHDDLCNCAAGKDVCIWNISWLNPRLAKLFKTISIIDEDEIDKLPKMIEYNEFASFNNFNKY